MIEQSKMSSGSIVKAVEILEVVQPEPNLVCWRAMGDVDVDWELKHRSQMNRRSGFRLRPGFSKVRRVA